VLLGRQAERARIECLLDDARGGRGGALVIRGEPGIGKTSLLRYALDLAEAMTVVRAVGVESEAELEYSGLTEIVRPLVSAFDGLPGHQAETLRGALGVSPSRPGDRFTVGAALLGLLSLVAETSPVLVVVDDAQWVDAASVDALSFAARRIAADPVAVLVGVREESRAFADAFAELTLEGLDADSAALLLRRTSDGAVPPEVAARLWEATGGNPLGLVELPRFLTPAQLEGDEGIAEPLPVGAGIQGAYAASIGRLPEATRSALVVLAVSSSGEGTAIAAALAEDGGIEALEPAEDAGLVELRAEGYVFGHPLVRSAVVQSAAPSARRRAHRKLAAALAGHDQERRAWHLAAAAVGRNEEAAEALAATAARARERGGHEAATDGFERAARLTPSYELRVERLADAAEEAWSIGDTSRTSALVDEVCTSDDVRIRARVGRLQGRMELQGGSSSHARDLLLESAARLEEIDVTEAVTTLGLAIFACHFAGRIEDAVEIGRKARGLAPRDGSRSDLDAEYLLGRALLVAGYPDEGSTLLERVLETLLAADDVPRSALMRTAIALGVLERGDEAAVRATEAVRRAREEGPMVLTYGLHLTTELAARHGRWSAALAAADEGLALAHELGQPTVAAHFLVGRARVEAGRGHEQACRAAAKEALDVLGPAGMALPSEHVACSLGLLDLGLGRLEDAAAHLRESARRVAEMGLHDRDVLPDPDLVEALVGLGRPSDATRALDAWLGRGGAGGTRLGAALAARCRGLLAGDDVFEDDFRTALELHELADEPFAVARTRLCLGERLRRAGRRIDARSELRAALETFDRLEAEPWITRARRELRATGEKVGRRAARTGDELTAQELQVALLVAEGKTNREVGAALFLSPKTVEFHLARVYRKLDLTSRAELIRRVSTGELEPLVAT
jgi:DNA-binding CsgD family transcriptional regulator